jgi:hypothetical protein
LISRYRRTPVSCSEASSPPPLSSSLSSSIRPWLAPKDSQRWRNPDVFEVDDAVRPVTRTKTDFSGNEFWPIPLESVMVNVIIHDFAAQVTSTYHDHDTHIHTLHNEIDTKNR